jgi:hypothetical protein
MNDLLRIMQVTKKTGSLVIEGQRRGTIHFVEGSVTGADLSGEHGSYKGTDRAAIADILYVLSTLETGSFHLGAADGPDSPRYEVEEVLGEVSALRSLEGEVIDAGLFEAPAVRLMSDLAKPITLAPDDWQVFVMLVQPFTFDYLESRIGRGSAVRIFHMLHRLGVAEPVGADGETEFLDKLADEIAPPTIEPDRPEQVREEESSLDDAEAAQLPTPDLDPAFQPEPDEESEPVGALGVAAPASTTLTDGVYDEIRRLRSKVAEGK